MKNKSKILKKRILHRTADEEWRHFHDNIIAPMNPSEKMTCMCKAIFFAGAWVTSKHVTNHLRSTDGLPAGLLEFFRELEEFAERGPFVIRQCKTLAE